MAFLKIFQLIIAVALILAVLLQNKGAGLGGLFGGSNNVYSSKRGLDKILFIITIVLVITFFVVSLSITIF